MTTHRNQGPEWKQRNPDGQKTNGENVQGRCGDHDRTNSFAFNEHVNIRDDNHEGRDVNHRPKGQCTRDPKQIRSINRKRNGDIG